MGDNFIVQAAIVTPMGAGTQSSVLANTALATAINLSALVDTWVSFKATVKTHVRFHSTDTIAPTTTDYYLTPDVDYPLYITSARKYMKHKGAGSVGKLHYVQVSDKF